MMARGSGDHHRGGMASLNQGKTPWRYASRSCSGSTSPPTATRPSSSALSESNDSRAMVGSDSASREKIASGGWQRGLQEFQQLGGDGEHSIGVETQLDIPGGSKATGGLVVVVQPRPGPQRQEGEGTPRLPPPRQGVVVEAGQARLAV